MTDEGFGVCFTRTGRRFFDDDRLERELLTRARAAAEAAGLFDRLATDWLLLDCEVMPWSAKAQELLREQYAAVGAAAKAGLSETVTVLQTTAASGIDVGPLLESFEQRAEDAGRFVDAYRRYCWPIQSIDDVKLAPFHLLAGDGAVHADKSHLWHMETLADLAAADQLVYRTAYTIVDTTNQESEHSGTVWWTDLTERGGEGMVVKRLD